MCACLLPKSVQQGNPRFAATWKDEGLNKVIRDIAAKVGAVNFDARVLLRFRAERCGALPEARKRKLHSA